MRGKKASKRARTRRGEVKRMRRAADGGSTVGCSAQAECQHAGLLLGRFFFYFLFAISLFRISFFLFLFTFSFFILSVGVTLPMVSETFWFLKAQVWFW
jgi:hypothetical protein